MDIKTRSHRSDATIFRFLECKCNNIRIAISSMEEPSRSRRVVGANAVYTRKEATMQDMTIMDRYRVSVMGLAKKFHYMHSIDDSRSGSYRNSNSFNICILDYTFSLF
jgi:hypothetical protein